MVDDRRFEGWFQWDPKAPERGGMAPRMGGQQPAAFAYDAQTALVSAVASTWAYSTAQTLRDVLHRSVLPEVECTPVEVSNATRLLDTQAFVVRQAQQNVTLVVFRGTEIAGSHSIDLLTDLAVDPVVFPQGSSMRVHRGFLDSLVAVWPPLLDALEKHDSDHLVLTGHSLGGALASLMAVMLCLPRAGGVMSNSDEALRERLRDRVVGSYTFGQPMVGEPEFAAFAEATMREAGMPPLVRHVFDDDVIPRQPGRKLHRFAHFGQEYRADDGSQQWMLSEFPLRQDRTGLLSLAVGALDFGFRQFWGLRRFELPRSLSDHLPQHYVDVCKRQVFGAQPPYYP